MKKIATKYVTYYISKNVVKLVGNIDELNKLYVKKDEIDPDHLYEFTIFLRRERLDGKEVWVEYEDCTYFDHDNDVWCRIINRDGSMPSYYWSYAFSETLQYALWSLFND